MDVLLSQIAFESKTIMGDELKQHNLIKESIERFGLFHPVILQGDSSPYRIVAGYRRVAIFKELDLEVIPATILPESCHNPHEIALHENLRRNNLQWYDQVDLELELHNLRTAEHGKKPLHGRGPRPGWSQADTARELGLALGTFSQDVQLAQALQKNPHLRLVKDKTTALKLVKQTANREIQEIESLAPTEFTFDQVFLGDSAVILKSFESALFDACITDPPWSEYKDEKLTSPVHELLGVFREVYRVLKRNSFLYVVVSSTDLHDYHELLTSIGFQVQSYPLIWHKQRTITHGRRAWQYARDYEPIIVAVKGNPVLTSGTENSSILTFDNLHYSKMIHPHEKPIGLLKSLIGDCTFPGGKILDPFAGSGATHEAARALDRRYIGIEKDLKFFKGIERRLGNEGLGSDRS